MQTDPSWFYSSLAQSAAAIIGVVAAVAIARLQQQVAALRLSRRDLEAAVEQLGLEIQRVEELLEAYLTWAISTKERVRNNTTSAGGVALPADRTLTTPIGSQHISDVREAETMINSITERITFVDKLRPSISALTKATTPTEVLAANVSIKFHAAQLFDVPEDRHLLDAVILRGNDAARAATQIEAERSPRIAAVTAIVLVWLVTFGVVMPLANLSAHSAASKQQMLVLFVVGIAALPVLIVYEVIKLRQLGKYNIRIPQAPIAV